jgi:hypothetical protein
MHTVASPPKYTIPFIDLLATIAAQGGVTLENARMRRNLHVIADIAWPSLLSECKLGSPGNRLKLQILGDGDSHWGQACC